MPVRHRAAVMPQRRGLGNDQVPLELKVDEVGSRHTANGHDAKKEQDSDSCLHDELAAIG